MKYTDPTTGEEHEIDATPEQIKEWQEKAAKTTELETTLAQKEEALQKLAQKDLNFSKFREKTQQEQEEIKAKWSEETRMLYEKAEALEQKLEVYTTANLKTAEEKILKDLAGDDEKLKESMKNQAKELGVEDAKTPEEIERKYRNSYLIIKGQKPTARPLFNFMPSMGEDDPDAGEPDFIKTPRGKQTYDAVKEMIFGKQDKK